MPEQHRNRIAGVNLKEDNASSSPAAMNEITQANRVASATRYSTRPETLRLRRRRVTHKACCPHQQEPQLADAPQFQLRRNLRS